MNRIEMIGASAVGKTTLYNRLVRSNKKEFMAFDDFIIKATLNLDTNRIKNVNIKYLRKYLELGIKFKRNGVARTILNSLYKNEKEKYIQYIEGFKHSISALYEDAKNSETPYVSINRICLFNKTMKLFYALNDYNNKDKVCLVDEGLLHYNNGLSTQYLVNRVGGNLKNDSIFKVCGVVFCYTENKIAFQQAIKRKEANRTLSHGHLSNRELEIWVSKDLEKNYNKMKLIEQLNIPILKINTQENTQTNISNINEFAKEITEKNILTKGKMYWYYNTIKG